MCGDGLELSVEACKGTRDGTNTDKTHVDAWGVVREGWASLFCLDTVVQGFARSCTRKKDRPQKTRENKKQATSKNYEGDTTQQ